MPQSLVKTKLRAPRPRRNLVARPRLSGILSAGEGRVLTLVSAPAGFGKSTLLAAWAEGWSATGGSVAWVSLDGSDDDPARFLNYLVGAVRTVEPCFGEEILASLRSPGFPPVEALATALVNELAELPQDTVLILDDYHEISAQPIHALVSFLLERLPENAHLVISGRADPPLPLPRLRARGQMAELRAADLRFTPKETAAFLNDAMGLALSADDVAALEGVTEGWVAALQLAALSMRDREDVSGFVEAFSGSNRHVLDFLADEVLERQPEGVKEFLLRTSVLERMSAPLCDALTGREDGQEMLERLDHDNLLVVALDDERKWYRYHRLFADFLRGRLERERAGQLVETHRRASGWYEENGLLPEAIGHALSASDHERAARLVERGIKEVWPRRSEFPTVLRWLEALPAEAKCRRPRLFPAHAVALVLTGRPDDAKPLLEEAERAADEATTGEDRLSLLGSASAIRSWRARLRGDAPEAVELARRALSLLPDEEAPIRNFAAICLGEALRTIGDLSAASEAFTEAAEIGRAAGYVYGTLTGMVLHARVQAERGRLREAGEEFRRALQLLTEEGFELLPAAGVVHTGMGELLYERNDLDGAERELSRGMQLAERAGEVTSQVWAYVAFSRARWSRGDDVGALAMAHEAERVASASGADLQVAIAGGWMTRLRLARGDLAEVAAFEQERAASTGDAADAARVVDRLTSARILLARGRHREAVPVLEGLGEAAAEAGRGGELIEVLALQALALWAGSERGRAVSTLGEALALAEPEGYVRTFVDEGAPMGDLLAATLEARERGRLDTANRVSARYLAKLLAALTEKGGSSGADERLSEPLSERELEVLALIAAGESNREIAGRLFVSTSTVKSHVNNLFRKLQARNRTQATARAREMNLL